MLNRTCSRIKQSAGNSVIYKYAEIFIIKWLCDCHVVTMRIIYWWGGRKTFITDGKLVNAFEINVQDFFYHIL